MNDKFLEYLVVIWLWLASFIAMIIAIMIPVIAVIYLVDKILQY